MPITETRSDLMTLRTVGSGPNAPANRRHFALRGMRFEVTQGTAPGDIGSTLVLCEIPQRGRLLPHFGWLGWDAFGVGCTVSLGWQEHILPDDAVVPASIAGLGGPLDVSLAGTAQLNTLPNMPSEWEAPVNVVLVLTVEGGPIPPGCNIGGEIAYGFSS